MRLLLFGSDSARIGLPEYLIRIMVYSLLCAALWEYHLSHDHSFASELSFFACCAIGIEWGWVVRARILNTGFSDWALLAFFVAPSGLFLLLSSLRVIGGPTAFVLFLAVEAVIGILRQRTRYRIRE